MNLASRRAAAIVALVCCALLFVGINVIAGRTLSSGRLDLTHGHLFTLSEGSKTTLAKIDEPITLRFYYSKRLGDEVPSYAIYGQRVRDMLDEYVSLARGKLKLAPLPSASRAYRSTRPASRSISALPPPTRPTTSK